MAIEKSLSVFIKKVVVFALLFASIMTAIYFGTGALNKQGRLSTIIDKHQRLETIQESKCILVSGSSMHYGIDSKMLEDSLGKKVVNMGIQGSIGLNYMIEEVKPFIKEGDIIILAPEHTHFNELSIHGENTLYRLVSIYPKGIQYLNIHQIMDFPPNIGLATGEHLTQIRIDLTNKLKKRSTFRSLNNKYGDYIGHKDKKGIYNPSETAKNHSSEKIKPETIHLIKEFAKYIASKKATLIISYSPVSKSDENEALNQAIVETLRAEKLPLVGDINSYVYPNDFFFDTSHHLNYDKRQTRTKQLIADIRNSKILK